MQRPVVLFLRTNINWVDMTPERFAALEECNSTVRRVSSHEKSRLTAGIKAWDELFGLTYFAYRHRIRQIAETTWSRIIGLDLFIKSSTLEPVLSELKDYVLLPVDDDDWFHPRVAQVLLKHVNERTEALYWDDAVLGDTHKRDSAEPVQAFRLRSPNNQICTNNYALTKAGYLKYSSDDRRRILLDHVFACEQFQKGLLRYDQVPRWCLAMTNKTLASTVNLWSTEGPSHLVKRLKELVDAPIEVPAPVEWAAGYIRQVQDLNLALYESAHARP